MNEWQLHGSAPELYQRYLVPAVTAIWAADLVYRAGLRSGARVLDVACGTGVVARAAAERVGRIGWVAGIDINPGMLAVARSSQADPSSQAGPESWIGWFLGSALALPFAGAGFDVVLCQLGLQFFPDRPAALAEMHRVLAPGGRVGLNVYGTIEHNPATFALAQALDRHVGPGAAVAKRAEHLLADTVLLYRLVSEAGFRRISVVTETRIVRFRSAADYVRIQMTATPLASLLTTQEGAADRLMEALIHDVAADLQPFDTGGGLALPQEAHILLADT